MDYKFWTRSLLFAGLFSLILAGCGGKKSSNTTDDNSGLNDFGSFNAPQDPFAGLPPNLFSGSTGQDPLPPSTSTSGSTMPSTGEAMCLANDQTLFSGLGPIGQTNQFPDYYGNQELNAINNGAQYCRAQSVNPALFWQLGSAMMGNLDQCLTTLLSYQPRNDEEAYDLSIVAEMGAFRCIRAELRKRMGRFGGQAQNQQAYNDGQFYWVIQSLSQMR